MSSVSDPSKPADKRKRPFFSSSFFHLPRNVYLLLFFTTGKGLQLSIAALTINLYVHSLGYQPDFIGLFSAMPAIGALLGAVPTGLIADRFGRKPLLLISALLSPLFLALTGFVSSTPILLAVNFIQGLSSTAYWVTNLPLLTESTTERQRVGVFALNSFLLLGVGALGNLLGGAIPEYAAGIFHVSAASTVALRWGVFAAASSTFLFGIPLWFLQEPKKIKNVEQEIAINVEEGTAGRVEENTTINVATSVVESVKDQTAIRMPVRPERRPVSLFLKLLIPDLLFTMGEGAVVALIQLFFVLRFQLLPGPLGVIFTISGLLGGIFSLTAPLFVKRWSKLRLITTVQYLTAPLMILIGFAPTLPLAIAGEYTRSFMRTLIEPVYAAFAMEQVSNRQRSTLAGLYSVTWSIGFSIGPAIAGWLQTNVNLSASFIYGSFCLALAPTLLLIFFSKRATSSQS